MKKNDLKEEIQRLFGMSDSIDCATPEEPVTSEALASVLYSVVSMLGKLIKMPVFDPDRNVHGVIRAGILNVDAQGYETPETNATSGCELFLECIDGDPYKPLSLCLYDRKNKKSYHLDEDGNEVNEVYKDYLIFNDHGVYIITGIDVSTIETKILRTE